MFTDWLSGLGQKTVIKVLIRGVASLIDAGIRAFFYD